MHRMCTSHLVTGEKEPMWPSAMADCILEGEVAHFTSYEDERITEHDIRRLEKYLPGVHMRSMLVVPVRCQQAGNRMSCAGLLVALNKRLKVPGGYTEVRSTRTGICLSIVDIHQLL